MGVSSKRFDQKAQTALEYIILLSVVAVIVLLGFKTFIPSVQKDSGNFFNKVASGIMGTPASHVGNFFKARTYKTNYP